MPKIVNPEHRREVIADALFAVLRDGGLSNVTLANVADRAGLAIGSVRHFLGTREEMMAFAFETVSDRFRDRILARAQTLLTDLDGERLCAESRLEATADLLCEFLPLDEARRDEAVVWIEFEVAARTDPQLAETSQRATAQTTRLIEVVLESIHARASTVSDLDIGLEAARLSALLDGLTIRSVLHSEVLAPGIMRQIVIAHLRKLRRAPDGRGAAGQAE